MLTLVLGSLIAAQAGGLAAAGEAAPPSAPGPAIKTCPDGSVIHERERCFEHPDHRKLLSLEPPRMTHSIEWTCGKSSAGARIRITEQPHVDEQGNRVYKHLFKIELVDLQVDGRPTTENTTGQVRAALTLLNSVRSFYGRCIGDRPALNIIGHSLIDNPREPRLSEILLK